MFQIGSMILSMIGINYKKAPDGELFYMSELIDRTDGSIPCIFSILVICQVFFLKKFIVFS